MTVQLDGQVAIVTGGAHGIGRAITQALADYGAQIAIVDIHDGDLRAVVGECLGDGAADAVRAAGDDGDLAVQLDSHGFLLTCAGSKAALPEVRIRFPRPSILPPLPPHPTRQRSADDRKRSSGTAGIIPNP